MTEKQIAEAKLHIMNAQLAEHVKAKKQWMDEHMHLFAAIPVGQDIFNLDTGEHLGVVTEHYRFWANQDDLLDTTFDIEYRYRTSDGPCPTIDNTSRQPHLNFGPQSKIRMAVEV